MQIKPTIANALWCASNLPAYARFSRALINPEQAQQQRLRSFLQQNSRTAFGKAHEFQAINNYKDFSRRVPLAQYESFVPWIDRIMRGESNVLTQEPVTHLVPTSGSMGARKLIPFTAGLQREFNAAIGPWIVDLQRQWPGTRNGPAYWSVTPSFKESRSEKSIVPIGFDTDTAYLGGARRLLAEAVMAVPSNVQQAKSIEAFRYETLLYLLRCRALRLISVWHPSFLTLLLDALPSLWENLLDDMARGRNGKQAPFPARSKELRNLDPKEPARFWPELRLISCWGDAHAETLIPELQSRFPNVAIQRKGLLATEAVMTIPFCERHPLAVRSHFFEFLDDQNRPHRAHEVREGSEYEIVVTTGSGLCRYRMGDLVRVTGFIGKTPALKFIGRKGDVSDRFGEKLSEPFVTEVIRQASVGMPPPKFMLLAPDESEFGSHYTFYVEGELRPEISIKLDALLRTNPHYDWCRELGQLRALRLFRIHAGGFESFVQRECASGKRIGDVKPRSLSPRNEWSKFFQGHYVPCTAFHSLAEK